MTAQELIFGNGRIKVYAFILSFVFWVIILGQKNIVVTKGVPVQYLIGKGFKVQDSTDKVTLTLSGKRSSLRRFDESESAAVLDLRSASVGPRRLPIDKNSLELPIGVKILSFEPKFASVYIVGNSVSDN